MDIIIVSIIYLFPTIIALSRGISGAAGVGVLNVFLGWTFIGWVVALVWAVSGKTQHA